MKSRPSIVSATLAMMFCILHADDASFVRETPDDRPLVKGGQGKSGRDIRRSAVSTFRVMRAGAAAMAVIALVSIV